MLSETSARTRLQKCLRAARTTEVRNRFGGGDEDDGARGGGARAGTYRRRLLTVTDRCWPLLIDTCRGQVRDELRGGGGLGGCGMQ